MRHVGLHQRLRRQTTTGLYLPEIDGLRCVAIAVVVLYHIGFVGPLEGLAYRLASYGHYGVQLFFGVSGFVLALPFARHRLADGPPISLRAYFVRRLTRLEPPYVLMLLGCTLLLGVAQRITLDAALSHLGASLLYLHNLIYGAGSTINVVAWSLEIEVQFYCLAPVLAVLFTVERVIVRRTLMATLALFCAMLAPPPVGRWGLSLAGFLQYFLVGLLVADWYVTDWRHAAPWWWRGLQRVLRNRWLATIGGMCYSIYLVHFPVISVLGRYTRPLGVPLGPTGHFLVQALVLVPPVLGASVVFFVLVEQPCMDRRWPGRLWARVRSHRDGALGKTLGLLR